jgi:dynein heavy chain
MTRCIAQEVAALPGCATVGFIKVSAKPLKASLATWASKWIYLFTHYLQVRVCVCVAGRWCFDSLLAQQTCQGLTRLKCG